MRREQDLQVTYIYINLLGDMHHISLHVKKHNLKKNKNISNVAAILLLDIKFICVDISMVMLHVYTRTLCGYRTNHLSPTCVRRRLALCRSSSKATQYF